MTLELRDLTTEEANFVVEVIKEVKSIGLPQEEGMQAVQKVWTERALAIKKVCEKWSYGPAKLLSIFQSLVYKPDQKTKLPLWVFQNITQYTTMVSCGITKLIDMLASGKIQFNINK